VNRNPNNGSSRREEAPINPELSLTPCFSRVCCAGPYVGTVLTVSFCAWAPPKTETVKTVELPGAARTTSLKRGVNEMWRPPTQNPKGIPQQSPGLRAASYPGKTPPINHNPERVAAPHEHKHDAKNPCRHNPFRVDDDCRTLPRGNQNNRYTVRFANAPLSQPWASLRNSVGIEEYQERRDQSLLTSAATIIESAVPTAPLVIGHLSLVIPWSLVHWSLVIHGPPASRNHKS